MKKRRKKEPKKKARTNATNETAIKKEHILGRVLESLEKGSTISSACQSAQIGRITLWRWRKEKEIDDRIKAVLESRVEIVEDALYVKAASGHVTAQIFYLCNRRPDRWQNVQKIEGVKVQQFTTIADIVKAVNEGNPYDKLSDEELQEEFERRRHKFMDESRTR